MKNILKYSGYAFMILAWIFIPFYVYISALTFYYLVVNGIYFFRINENLKGIFCMLGAIFIILFVYMKFMLDILYKGLSNANFTIF